MCTTDQPAATEWLITLSEVGQRLGSANCESLDCLSLMPIRWLFPFRVRALIDNFADWSSQELFRMDTLIRAILISSRAENAMVDWLLRSQCFIYEIEAGSGDNEN